MHLTDITIYPERGVRQAGGIDIAVEVEEDGKFTAEFDGEHFEAKELGRLESFLRDAVLSTRIEVPFVHTDGRRGVMRGWHAGNRDVLVTWSDGSKGRMTPHSRVFRELDDATREELLSLAVEAERIDNRLREILSESEQAADVFSAAFGEDLDDFRRHVPVEA